MNNTESQCLFNRHEKLNRQVRNPGMRCPKLISKCLGMLKLSFCKKENTLSSQKTDSGSGIVKDITKYYFHGKEYLIGKFSVKDQTRGYRPKRKRVKKNMQETDTSQQIILSISFPITLTEEAKVTLPKMFFLGYNETIRKTFDIKK